MVQKSPKSDEKEVLALAREAARFASGKKAEEVVLLDMRGIVNYCDYFVICSATAARHVKAIADGIEEGLAGYGIKVRYSSGLDAASRGKVFSWSAQPEPAAVDAQARGNWALLDMGDVVVHIFETGARDFYGLEHLWQGAPKVDW